MLDLRLNVLFYTFLAIFAATALVTLLGLVGTLSIPPTQLTVLVGAFFVELAGAVIALFRRTDFFVRPPESTAASIGAAFEGLDRISDEITATIKNVPVRQEAHPYGFLIQRMGNSIVAYARMKVITGQQLDQLPERQRVLVKQYERSMERLVHDWMKLKGGKGSSVRDERERDLELLRKTKDDLVGLLDFLQGLGIYLDDHYQEVRALVSQL